MQIDNMIRLIAALGAGLLAASVARADCFEAAGQYQHVNPWLLRAIAWVESHNQPDALHANANGTIDYGLMQINSVHLPSLQAYGISLETVRAACPNVYIAAWHLRHQIDRYGNTWAAVGAYHSLTPALRDAYAARIIATLSAWGVVGRDGARAPRP